jgi:hypothetical protein
MVQDEPHSKDTHMSRSNHVTPPSQMRPEVENDQEYEEEEEVNDPDVYSTFASMLEDEGEEYIQVDVQQVDENLKVRQLSITQPVCA